jgi:hypothetical protein
MAEHCNRCRFWQPAPKSIGEHHKEAGLGSCRVAPPVLVQQIAGMLAPRGEFMRPELSIADTAAASIFPATFATDWCGRFEGPGYGEMPC